MMNKYKHIHINSFILYNHRHLFSFEIRVCDEFENVKARALKQPDTIEELNETLKFMETAKSTGYQALVERIKALITSMTFLLDTHLFPKEDIDSNARVLMWPADIMPVFDENEEVTHLHTNYTLMKFYL